MKATGFIELAILIAALVTGLPLFIACVIYGNNMHLTYIADKSTWNITEDIEWEVNAEGVLVPKSSITPQVMTLAQSLTLPYVQDEYSPNIGRHIIYNFDANQITDDTTPDKEITIADDSRGYRYLDKSTIGELCPITDIDTKKDKNFYYVYNPVKRGWMITNEFINVLAY